MGDFTWGIIAGITVGLIVGFLLDQVRAYVGRPRIVIEEIAPLGSYVSVSIRNKGRGTAKGCEGLLTLDDVDPHTDLAHVPEPTTLRPGSFRPVKDMNLCWARMVDGNPTSISLYPKTTQLLDLCKIEKSNPPVIRIPSESGWSPLRVALMLGGIGHKEYKGKLKIVAENTAGNPADQADITLKLEDGRVLVTVGDKNAYI